MLVYTFHCFRMGTIHTLHYPNISVWYLLSMYVYSRHCSNQNSFQIPSKQNSRYPISTTVTSCRSNRIEPHISVLFSFTLALVTGISSLFVLCVVDGDLQFQIQFESSLQKAKIECLRTTTSFEDYMEKFEAKKIQDLKVTPVFVVTIHLPLCVGHLG